MSLVKFENFGKCSLKVRMLLMWEWLAKTGFYKEDFWENFFTEENICFYEKPKYECYACEEAISRIPDLVEESGNNRCHYCPIDFDIACYYKNSLYEKWRNGENLSVRKKWAKELFDLACDSWDSTPQKECISCGTKISEIAKNASGLVCASCEKDLCDSIYE